VRIALKTITMSVGFIWLLLMATMASADQLRIGPGDDKRGYESRAYQTDSLSLEKRLGKAANLLEFAKRKQLGLPAPNSVWEIEPNAKQIELGRRVLRDVPYTRARFHQ